jgi:hypothetical protein
MVILRATSILRGQKGNKWMICSITLLGWTQPSGAVIAKFHVPTLVGATFKRI